MGSRSIDYYPKASYIILTEEGQKVFFCHPKKKKQNNKNDNINEMKILLNPTPQSTISQSSIDSAHIKVHSVIGLNRNRYASQCNIEKNSRLKRGFFNYLKKHRSKMSNEKNKSKSVIKKADSELGDNTNKKTESMKKVCSTIISKNPNKVCSGLYSKNTIVLPTDLLNISQKNCELELNCLKTLVEAETKFNSKRFQEILYLMDKQRKDILELKQMFEILITISRRSMISQELMKDEFKSVLDDKKPLSSTFGIIRHTTSVSFTHLSSSEKPVEIQNEAKKELSKKNFFCGWCKLLKSVAQH